MKTLQKISKAIESIKGMNLKKKGRNKFSNYDYYTPDQVSELVTRACHKVGLLTKFDLIRNELGITGQLSVYDIETPADPIVYHMASDIPSIKATNVAQQLGGAMTYTKRYLLMNAFEIADNNLDFDTTENTKVTAKPKTQVVDKLSQSLVNRINDCITIKELTTLWNANKELHLNKEFIDLGKKRKAVLKQNGINN